MGCDSGTTVAFSSPLAMELTNLIKSRESFRLCSNGACSNREHNSAVVVIDGGDLIYLVVLHVWFAPSLFGYVVSQG